MYKNISPIGFKSSCDNFYFSFMRTLFSAIWMYGENIVQYVPIHPAILESKRAQKMDQKT